MHLKVFLADAVNFLGRQPEITDSSEEELCVERMVKQLCY